MFLFKIGVVVVFIALNVFLARRFPLVAGHQEALMVVVPFTLIYAIFIIGGVILFVFF